MINSFRILDIAASGMSAERLRIEVISNNLANVNTTRTEEGGPYTRRVVLFQEALQKNLNSNNPNDVNNFSGVRVVGIKKDTITPYRLVYDPSHPDADKNGYVKYPNVNPLKEMVDLISAQRAYEANAAIASSVRAIVNAALNIIAR